MAYLNNVSRPLILFFYIVLAFFTIMLLNVMNMIGDSFFSFKQSLWQSYNIPATISILLYMSLWFLGGAVLYVIINSGLKLMYRLPLWFEMLLREVDFKFIKRSSTNVIEGEVVE